MRETGSINWDDFNVKDIKSKHKIAKHAKTDAALGIPREDHTTSDTENEIINEGNIYLESQKNKARPFFKNLEDKINSLADTLKQNHFTSLINNMKSAFNNSLNLIKLKISDTNTIHKKNLSDYNYFRKVNRLDKEPNPATLNKLIMGLSLIIALFSFEIIMNGKLVGAVLPGGENEGKLIAFAVAFINVILSFIIGFNLVKSITHIDKQKRVLALIFSTIFFVIATYMNWCYGAFRSIAEDAVMGGNFDAAKIHLFLKDSILPYKVSFSFPGIILVVVGISFSIISILDGFLMDDTYPGYGRVFRKLSKSRNKILSLVHEQSKKTAEIFNEYDNKIDLEKSQNLNQNVVAWDSNTNLLQKELITFEDKVKNCEEGVRHIIDEYRQLNTNHRSTPPPKYFGEEFKFKDDKINVEHVFREVKEVHLDDKQREMKKTGLIKFIEANYVNCVSEVKVFKEKAISLNKSLQDEHENI